MPNNSLKGDPAYSRSLNSNVRAHMKKLILIALTVLPAFASAEATDVPISLGKKYYERRVEFEHIPADCDAETGKPEKIIATRHKNKVVVDVFINVNCASSLVNPRYGSQLGHTISINTHLPDNMAAACECRSGLRYSIFNEYAAKPPKGLGGFSAGELKIKKGDPIYFLVDGVVALKANTP